MKSYRIDNCKGVRCVALLIIVLCLLISTPATAVEPGPAVVTPSKPKPELVPTDIPGIIKYYSDKGYVVAGPIGVKSCTPSEVVLPGLPDKEGISISLKNKKVSVMDQHGAALSLSALKPGTTILLAQKEDRALIYVVEIVKRGNVHEK